MPVIKSAKKKLRQDKKRTIQNHKQEEALKALMKSARKNPTEASVKLVQQAADKAVKKHLLHKNKVARLKSSFAKLLAGKAPKQEKANPKATSAKKPAAKKKTSKK